MSTPNSTIEDDDSFFMKVPTVLPKRQKQVGEKGVGNGKNKSNTIEIDSDTGSNSSYDGNSNSKKGGGSGGGKKSIGAPRSLKKRTREKEFILDSDDEEEEEDDNRRKKKLSSSPPSITSYTQLDRGGDELRSMAEAKGWSGAARVPLQKKVSSPAPIRSRHRSSSPMLEPIITKNKKKSPVKSKPKPSKPKVVAPPSRSRSPPPPPSPDPIVRPPLPESFWEAGESKTLAEKKAVKKKVPGAAMKELASLSKMREGLNMKDNDADEVEEIQRASESEEEDEGGKGKKYESVADGAKRRKAEGLAKLKAQRENKAQSKINPAPIVPPANPFVASKLAAAAKVKEGTSPCGICSKIFPITLLANHAESCFEKQALQAQKAKEQDDTITLEGSSFPPKSRVSNFRPSASISVSTSTKSTSVATAATTKNAVASTSKSIANVIKTTSSNASTSTLSKSIAAKKAQDAQLAADLGWDTPSTTNSKSKGKGKAVAKPAVEVEVEDYFIDDDFPELPEEDWEEIEEAAKKTKGVSNSTVKGKRTAMDQAGKGFETFSTTNTSRSKGKGKQVVQVDDDEEEEEEDDYDEYDMEIEDDVIEIEDDDDDDVILLASTAKNSGRVNTDHRKGPPIGSSPPKGSIYISTLPNVFKNGYNAMYTIKAPKAGKAAGIGPLAPQKMSAPFKKKSYRKSGWKRGAKRK